MDWAQFLSFVGVNLSMMAVLSGIMAYFLSRVDNHISRIEGRMNSHEARIDQLYQMFVDLLKEKKN